MSTHSLHTWWRQLAARERALISACAVFLLLALLWGVALAPALRTLRQHDANIVQLRASLSHMQSLQAQAKLIEGHGSISGNAAQRALQSHTNSLLGKQAELAIRNGGATVTLRGVSPQALGHWFATIRTEARAKVLQSHLQRTTEGWSGSVQLSLPE